MRSFEFTDLGQQSNRRLLIHVGSECSWSIITRGLCRSCKERLCKRGGVRQERSDGINWRLGSLEIAGRHRQRAEEQETVCPAIRHDAAI